MNVSDAKARLRERATSGDGPLARAVEHAQSIANDDTIFPGPLTVRDVVLAGGAVFFAAAVVGSRVFNVPTSLVFAQSIATENALTLYSTAAGIAGFIGSIIASTRLATVEADTVTVRQMAMPILVTAAGNIVAGFLFPSG